MDAFNPLAAIATTPRSIVRQCNKCSEAIEAELGLAKSQLHAHAAEQRTAKKKAPPAVLSRLEGAVSKAVAALKALEPRPCYAALRLSYRASTPLLVLAMQRGLQFGVDGACTKLDAAINDAFLATGVTVYDVNGKNPRVFKLVAFSCHEGGLQGGHYTWHALTKALEPGFPLGTVTLDDAKTCVDAGGVANFHAKFRALSRSAYVLYLVREDVYNAAINTADDMETEP